MLVETAQQFVAGRLSAAVFDDTYRSRFVFVVLEELAFACETTSTTRSCAIPMGW